MLVRDVRTEGTLTKSAAQQLHVTLHIKVTRRMRRLGVGNGDFYGTSRRVVRDIEIRESNR